MKYIKLIILFVFIISTKNTWCQSKIRKNFLVEGSDTPISNTCNDSCIIIYKNYTVITKPHINSAGEEINVINNSTKSSFKIDIHAKYNAQNFHGIFGHKAIIDAGTSLTRNNYIYDLINHTKIDSFVVVPDFPTVPKIENGKYYFSTPINEKRIKELNLPLCDSCRTEICGYIEKMYYDFNLKKKVYLEKYKCLD